MTMDSKEMKKSEKPSLVLVSGSDALTVAAMERIWNSLTGENFTLAERIWCQERIEASIGSDGGS